MELLSVACNRTSSESGLPFTEIGSEYTCGAFAGDALPTAIASWFTMPAWEASAWLSCGDGCGDEGNEKAGLESAAPPANACGVTLPTASGLVLPEDISSCGDGCGDEGNEKAGPESTAPPTNARGATLPTASGLVLPGDTSSGTTIASGRWNGIPVLVSASAKPASAEADLRPDEPGKSGSRAGGRAGCVICATRTGTQTGILPFAAATKFSFRTSFVFILVVPVGTIPLPGFRD